MPQFWNLSSSLFSSCSNSPSFPHSPDSLDHSPNSSQTQVSRSHFDANWGLQSPRYRLVNPDSHPIQTWKNLLRVPAVHSGGLPHGTLNTELTRQNNILELILSSCPELISTCTTGPGVSDHDHLVIVTANVRAKQNKKNPVSITYFETQTGHLFNPLSDQQRQSSFDFALNSHQ